MKVLVLGCGSIGKRHIRNLRHLGVDEILAFDPDQGRREEVAREFSVKAFGEMESALAQRPQLSIIAAPNHLHLPIAESSLRSGCHVFVEKPISHSWERVEELLGQAAKLKRMVAVGYQFRHHPGLQKVHRWVRDGSIGKVLSIRIEVGQYLPDWHPWEDYRKGYSAQKRMGGGALLDCSHELDMLLWLLGRPSRLWASYGRVSDLDIDVEDIAVVVARYDSGLIATVELDYLSRPAARNGRIIGSEGSIEWDLWGRTLRIYSAGRREWENHDDLMKIDGNELYISEQRDVLASIEQNRPPCVDGGAGLEALRFALLARISGRQGREVEWNHALS